MKHAIFFLCLSWICGVGAQSLGNEVIATSGGSARNSTVVLDWTVGEGATTTIRSTTLQVTQGFHQLNVQTTNIEELPSEVGRVDIFPNPTTDDLQAELNFNQSRSVEMRLIDAFGRVIWTKRHRGAHIRLTEDFSGFPAGTYVLSLLIDQRAYVQNYTIQKIK